MGIAAVLSHLREVQENFRIAHEVLLKDKPDALILVDYPSFNLRMAAYCRKNLPETKIYYYIPPKAWAWKRRRVHTISRLCDEVLGIFPFEPAFYAQYGYTCQYVGNPTMEAVTEWKTTHPVVPRKPLIAILPGSRVSEISNSLPRMVEAARCFPDYAIAVCAAPGIDEALYTPFLQRGDILTHDTYSTVQQASAAIVTSGTATLETALLGCPQVAVYHLALSPLVGLIRRIAQPVLFTIKHFTLVNIISGKEVIKEYVANDFTVENIVAELQRILSGDSNYKNEMLTSYEHLADMLGEHPASAAAAAIITA